jgi:hypothetical protein
MTPAGLIDFSLRQALSSASGLDGYNIGSGVTVNF